MICDNIISELMFPILIINPHLICFYCEDTINHKCNKINLISSHALFKHVHKVRIKLTKQMDIEITKV